MFSNMSDRTMLNLMSSLVFAQSTLIVVLGIFLRGEERDRAKYTSIIKYYDSILRREAVVLTKYDRIALSTMFDEIL